MTEQRPEGLLTVWQEESGWWRWRWEQNTDVEDSASLISHEAYPDAEAARSSATEAFPDCPVRDLDPDSEPEKAGPGKRWSRRRRAFAVMVVAAVVAARRLRRDGRENSSRRR